MRPIVLVLFSTTAFGSNDGMLWLEREWISDADATFAANPQVETLPERARTNFKSIFGQMRWEFSGGILEVKRPDAEPHSVAYFVRPIDDGSFEIILDEDAESTFLITRTKRGFCARLTPAWVPDVQAWTEPFITECFAPYGA